MDLVLGASWLATLGDVKVNWRILTMKFVEQSPVVKNLGYSSSSDESDRGSINIMGDRN